MSIFDSMSVLAVSVVTNLMGYEATWEPYARTSEAQTHKVLLREPTRTEELSGTAYAVNNTMMEYHEGQFGGLKESIDAGHSEQVTVNGKTYTVLAVNKKYDGRTYVAKLENPYGSIS